jgi:hypothetical protein
MQQELRFATFNVLNLAPPGFRFYADQEPYSHTRYEAKVLWIAQQLDLLDADVIGFQEIFSQEALKYVLSKTRKYRHAHHVGFNPAGLISDDRRGEDCRREQLTPSVAVVSRLPIVGTSINHTKLPHGLRATLPGISAPLDNFTRPILQVQVSVENTVATLPGTPPHAPQLIDVFVCHLKSKRPDFHDDEQHGEEDSYSLGMAMLRSTIRRATEALGLRYLISDQLRRHRLPLVVLGDFNDVVGATTTQLVIGATSDRTVLREGPTDRLYDSYKIQTADRNAHEASFTHSHNGISETIDHILVSDAFKPTNPGALGEVTEVVYLNDHLALKRQDASDHGLVLARLLLYRTFIGIDPSRP